MREITKKEPSLAWTVFIPPVRSPTEPLERKEAHVVRLPCSMPRGGYVGPRQTNGEATTTAVTYDVRAVYPPLADFFITDHQAMEGASLDSSTTSTNEASQQQPNDQTT
jgi:hypothetical protein